MKKQIIISTAIAAAIWGGTALAMATVNAKESEKTPELLATTTNLISPKPTALTSKNETVYVMTDENGNPTTKFIGSTLYDGAEELPFTLKVTYFLDGQEISAKDLAGKSGHVKIVYNYASTARFQGKFVPFLAVTGLTLDHAKFSNVRVNNGKILNESSDTYIVAGYALAGAGADLGIDFLPESFTLEADVTDFKLENTYTMFSNDFIADIDTSKLSDLDSLVNSIYQLSDGLNKIINGSSDLANGLAASLTGTKKLYEGSKDLVNGIKKITANNATLQGGANRIIQSTVTSLAAQGITVDFTQENPYVQLDYVINQYPEGSAERASLENAKNLLVLSTGIIAYTNGVAQLEAGATELSAGLGTLVEGQEKLYSGSATLKDGLNTFKTSGIDKLVNFAKKDLSNFTANARATVSAAGSYRSFGDANANTVKFIVKTPSI
jgi:putative membrane protein